MHLAMPHRAVLQVDAITDLVAQQLAAVKAGSAASAQPTPAELEALKKRKLVKPE